MKHPILCLALLSAAVAASAKEANVMVTVNGVPVRRTEVMERAFRQFGNTVLSSMVDDILIRQAAESLKVKADAKEVDARLRRIQSQLPDEATFKAKLAASGSSLEGLRAQIADQVTREELAVKTKNLSVTDAEVKEFFNANKEKLGAPEALRLRHILVANEKEAGDFLIAVKAGADFARLASQVSLDKATKDKGGDLGFVSRGMLQPEIEKVVLSVKAGELGGPVQSAVGFHIFKVEEIRPATPAVFKDIGEDLKAALLAEKVNKAWPVLLQELRDKGKIVPPLQAAR